jgi:hypothetical protein
MGELRVSKLSVKLNNKKVSQIVSVLLHSVLFLLSLVII